MIINYIRFSFGSFPTSTSPTKRITGWRWSWWANEQLVGGWALASYIPCAFIGTSHKPPGPVVSGTGPKVLVPTLQTSIPNWMSRWKRQDSQRNTHTWNPKQPIFNGWQWWNFAVFLCTDLESSNWFPTLLKWIFGVPGSNPTQTSHQSDPSPAMRGSDEPLKISQKVSLIRFYQHLYLLLELVSCSYSHHGGLQVGWSLCENRLCCGSPHQHWFQGRGALKAMPGSQG